jgi:sugar phosphate isomerase/epimerase
MVPIFQPRTVVCHTGYDQKRYWGIEETWIENSLELWSWLSEEIRKGGSLLMLENVYEQNPQEFLDIYGALTDQHVGFCLDTGHMAAGVLGHLWGFDRSACGFLPGYGTHGCLQP